MMLSSYFCSFSVIRQSIHIEVEHISKALPYLRSHHSCYCACEKAFVVNEVIGIKPHYLHTQEII